ncbi:muscarinic acetylcholine receptor gar-2 [Biomphalaria glabrata]|uniref:Muscarinic acetylcholine receptor gar-2-like n=1 Tax=Biomphalaria glabrata TaxID=6526 RepID=A0A2C9JLE3_BIOGL|nr:muscarinic acetylcholine receptor gar-2-like [Biomphalaria glabrata]KAI8743492.1 putative muscarinic acetylcholine receptor gar-2 [Biomphalaria glabrata]KAI8778308.1 muscarinic acetylcholine receptor gar-2 [Biomphalaria glabrata]
MSVATPQSWEKSTTNFSAIVAELTQMMAIDNTTLFSSGFMDNMSSSYITDMCNGTCSGNGSNNGTSSKADDPGQVYSIGVTVILGLLVGIVSLVTVLGNITVLLAFGLERTIRQPTNYYLASLAVSDLLIGTFSMPLYTQYLLIGRWPLGPWLCDLWLSLDWTVCLTSQYTVFLITMDRFLSVKIPAKYRNWRTERKVMVMISVTWILPACVFFTTIIGWQFFVGIPEKKEGNCEVQFMSDPLFTFLLTIGYYWITLFIMIGLYAGIYKVALDLQRKSDEKHKKMQSTMELAGDNPNAAVRSFTHEHDGASNNNSSGAGDSQAPQLKANKKSKKKVLEHSNSRKSVKAGLPVPPGTQAVNTTSFSTAKPEDKDEDRSSSPAFASDDDNSSSGGAVGTAKSPQSPAVYSGKPHPTGGIVNSVLYANTGGLVRSLHGDLFFGQTSDAPGTQNLLQPPPPYSTLDVKNVSDTGSDVEGSQLLEFDSVYSSSASDRLEKQTTPLLQNEILKGCRFIDEKSFMATLSSESAALLPVITGESELDDSDVNDLHASSPIWKRRTSLPPLATDVFDLDDDASDCLISTDFPTTTSNMNASNVTPVYSNSKNNHKGQRPRADTANTLTSTTTGADTGTDDSSGNKSSEAPHGAHSDGQGNNCSKQQLSDTNEDSGRSDTNCLSAVRRRQNKDTRLHTFVKSVRSRNSRRRNRRERKSKSENRARKALRTISFILGAFLLCWTPYHVAILIQAIDSNWVNPVFYSFSYWLCYLNSPINPFCYAFANVQFKRTFLRIMRFNWHRT